VDVGGVRGDRVLDEEVHQPDHRRFERHVAELVDVLVALAGRAVVLHAFDDALQRRRDPLVRAIECVGDRILGAHYQAHLQAGGLAQIVDDHGVQRVRRGYREHAPVDRERTHAVLPQVFQREILDHGQRRRELGPREVGQSVLESHHAEDVARRDDAHRDERFPEALAAVAHPLDGDVEDFGGNERFLDEELAEARGGGGHHAMLPRMLAYSAFAAVHLPH
jgi:hypothetical protein